MKKIFCIITCAILIFTIFAGCSAERLSFTGSDYNIPELDLSTLPNEYKNTEYEYLYKLSVVDNSKDNLAHPDSVLPAGTGPYSGTDAVCGNVQRALPRLQRRSGRSSCVAGSRITGFLADCPGCSGRDSAQTGAAAHRDSGRLIVCDYFVNTSRFT